MNIAPGKPLPCFIQNLKTSDKAYIKSNLSIIKTLAKLENIKQLSENDSAPESATASGWRNENTYPIGRYS